MMYGWDFSGWGGWLMLAGMAVVAIAIVVSVWLITSRSGVASRSAPDAMGILRERYARGEITKEEFEDARRTLG